jgi:hypothetical protein
MIRIRMMMKMIRIKRIMRTMKKRKENMNRKEEMEAEARQHNGRCFIHMRLTSRKHDSTGKRLLPE